MEHFKILAKVFQIAYDVAGGLLIGVLVGMMLDKWLKTRALFLIIFSIWGIIHGFKALISLGD